MAKEEKPILGHIDCPHCAEKMGVKHDKNGDPFGHCEECGGQLRVGGNPARLRKFLTRHPWAAKPTVAAADPVTVTEKPRAPAPVPAPTAPVTAPAPQQRRRASFADALGVFGVGAKNAA